MVELAPAVLIATTFRLDVLPGLIALARHSVLDERSQAFQVLRPEREVLGRPVFLEPF